MPAGGSSEPDVGEGAGRGEGAPPPAAGRPLLPHAPEQVAPGADPARVPSGDGLSMYDEMASWFDLLGSPGDYAGIAAFLLDLLRRHVRGPLEALLELGSGGGNTASHLGRDVHLVLTDLSPAMLDLSRALNPAAEHVRGDMRTLRLGRQFDAVLATDGVMYMTTPADLRDAVQTAWVHLRPGGAAVFAPGCTRETFEPATRHGGSDGAGKRALRFLEWDHDPDPLDTWYVAEFAMLLRDAGGAVRARHDRHVLGLFGRDHWMAYLRDAGFEPEAIAGPAGAPVFVGRRPA
jgi:trans-aconitate methyltransferase